MLRVKHVRISSPKTGSLKILLLSDLHLPGLVPTGEKVIREVKKHAPDLVLIAGDIANHRAGRDASFEFLDKLSQTTDVIAVQGDSDMCGNRGQCVSCFLNYTLKDGHGRKFSILRNRRIDGPGSNVSITGLDDPTSGLDEMALLDSLDPSTFNLLLLHSTHRLDQTDFAKVDLTLAGNTHGGQVLFARPFLRWYDASIDTRYLGGHYRVGASHLVVTTGIGTSSLPIRIGVPPQLVVIHVN